MIAGSHRLLLLALAALVAAPAASGCGDDGDADLVNGKELFVGKGTCGSCHELGRAGTKGQQGPSLDAAFKAAREDGLGEKTIEGIVMRQIQIPRRNSIMKPNLVTGDDARDVAAYVASAAGLSGKDTGALASAGQAAVSNKPIAAKGGTLTMDANPTGALAFASTKATAPAGPLTISMGNEASIPHDIALEDASGKQVGKGPVVNKGGTSKFSATVKKGKYTYVCTVPGHEDGGMKGELTVE